MPVDHAFVSAIADGADATLVRPSNWNADHVGSPDLLSELYDPAVDETVPAAATAEFDTDPLIIDSGRLVTVPATSLLWLAAPRYPSYWNGPFFNVKDFGAKGDGVTDDAAAIQKAIDACSTVAGTGAWAASGGTVYFPRTPDFYLVLSGMTVRVSTSICFLGESAPNSGANNGAMIVSKASSGSASLFNCQNTNSVHFKNLQIRTDQAAGWSGRVLDFRNVTGNDTAYALVEDCTVVGGATAISCVDFDKAIDSTLNRCVISGATNSVVGKASQASYSNAIQIRDCRFVNGHTTFIRNPGQVWHISGCTFEGLMPSIGNDGSAIANSLVIFANWFGDVTGAGVHITAGGSGIQIIGNYIAGSAGTTAVKISNNSSTGLTIIGNDFETHSIGIDFGATTGHSQVVIQGNTNTSVTTPLNGTLPIGAIYQDPINGNIIGPGSATIAPLKMTSGTNLTTPADGVLEFDGAAFYKTSDTTNGRKFDDSWHLFRLGANGSAISTIADFFGTNDGIPTVLNGVYEIEWHCYFTVATGGTSTWTIVNTQTVTNMVADWLATPIAGFATAGAVTAAGVKTQTAASVALPVTGSLTAADHYHKIHAVIEAGTAGNVRLRQTMSAGTSTPLRGSFFRVRRLAAGNVGTFVA